MDWIVVILSIASISLVYYLIFIQPKKESQERITREAEERHQKNVEKAFNLTKAVGEKEIRCVSVKINCDGHQGRAFYLIEKGAESDSSKWYYKLSQSSENHSVETARQNIYDIIKIMPYNILIEDLDISEYEFFLPRIKDKNSKDLKKDKIWDQKDIDDTFISDLCEFKSTIIRYLQSYICRKTM